MVGKDDFFFKREVIRTNKSNETSTCCHKQPAFHSPRITHSVVKTKLHAFHVRISVYYYQELPICRYRYLQFSHLYDVSEYMMFGRESLVFRISTFYIQRTAPKIEKFYPLSKVLGKWNPQTIDSSVYFPV